MQNDYDVAFSIILLLVLDGVLVISLGGVVGLPPRRGKDVLIPLVPLPQNDFA